MIMKVRIMAEGPLLTPSSYTFQSLPFSTNFYGRTDVYNNFTAHTVFRDHCGQKTNRKRDRSDVVESSPSALDLESTNGIFENQFRGRQLFGVRSKLPSSYAIALLRKIDRKADSNSDFVSKPPQKYFCLETVSLGKEKCISDTESTFCHEKKNRDIVSDTALWVWSHDRTPNAELLLSQWIALTEVVHEEA